MARTRRKPRTRVVAAVSAVSALGLLVGCSGGGEGTGGGRKDGKVTITMGLYGVMGFKESGLLDKYMEENPDVVVKAEIAGDEQTYYTALQTHLAAGSGLKDIQGIEIGRAKELVDTQQDKFSDLSGVKGTDHFLPWKQSQVTTADDKVIGLGTDIGPMAVCYRKDKFEEAGLPTDRDEVAKLWEGDWAKYVAVGERFKEGVKGDKVAFMDSASGLFNAMIYGGPQQFYDKEGELVYADNPVVKDAWKLASKAATSDLTAKLRQFQPGWDPGLANGTFATAVCPAWMMAHISEKAGEANKGKWDVAKAPKGANWGGSFLGVMENSPVKKEAQELVAWLTAPEQQAFLFQKQSLFPSSRTALESPEVAGAKSEYFNDAPIGEIFGAAAREVPEEQVLGRKDGTIKDIFSQGLTLIESQNKTPDDAWNTTDERIKKAVG
ncbi:MULTISPECIES: extracellular solute-binding protein [Streptomyces]|jgi:cellobiose transport system substrate-binding protein|uniref:Extracellular solute-binding protein n=1 Tax=Streptomyces odorifer TaxID=53450 RepID=A0A7Y6EYE0_9ACTN|nr:MULTISPECIES: extracellular solute-binding protein [Streptomyces]NUV33133.1 extracellular solute-binding protein [Streptomyces sp. KAI-27]NUV47677.1 extracellular solute-binding protein [Streptomyces sp. CAI-78]MBL0778132.1 extracellular solute-binding protein [Streptomyces albidoflavus]MBL0802798.1 extracellular solute-binding protein [Streptomyces albidoflavus]MBV1956427.1 extracellular solute-binding protein [Streptomyces sp. BV333]